MNDEMRKVARPVLEYCKENFSFPADWADAPEEKLRGWFSGRFDLNPLVCIEMPEWHFWHYMRGVIAREKHQNKENK